MTNLSNSVKNLIHYASNQSTKPTNVTNTVLLMAMPIDCRPCALCSCAQVQRSMSVKIINLLTYLRRSSDQCRRCSMLYPESLVGNYIIWQLDPKIVIAKILAFGSSVRDCHAYTFICKYDILADFNLAVAKADCQTTKFNSPPNFPAVQYLIFSSL